MCPSQPSYNAVSSVDGRGFVVGYVLERMKRMKEGTQQVQSLQDEDSMNAAG